MRYPPTQFFVQEKDVSFLFPSRKIPLESTELLIIEDDGGDVEKTIKTTKNNGKNKQTHQIKNDLSVESLNNNSDGNGDDSEEKSGSGEESGDKSGEEGGGGKPKLYGSILKHPGKVR